MSRLANLSKNKNTIMMRILGNQGLRKAMYYPESDFLDKPDVPHEQLLYKHLFPYRVIPNAQTQEKTLITLQFKEFRLVNQAFKSGYILINVICHRDVVQTDYDFLRHDYIISEIEKLANDQHGIGIGKLSFHEFEELDVDDQYLGQYIAYKLYEFN